MASLFHPLLLRVYNILTKIPMKCFSFPFVVSLSERYLRFCCVWLALCSLSLGSVLYLGNVLLVSLRKSHQVNACILRYHKEQLREVVCLSLLNWSGSLLKHKTSWLWQQSYRRLNTFYELLVNHGVLVFGFVFPVSFFYHLKNIHLFSQIIILFFLYSFGKIYKHYNCVKDYFFILSVYISTLNKLSNQVIYYWDFSFLCSITVFCMFIGM